ALAADAGSVHEAVVAAVAEDVGVHGVHGGAGDGRDDGTLFAGEAVEESGFADVGSADDGDFRDLRRFLRGGDGLRLEFGEGGVEEIVHARAVFGGDGKAGSAERVKFRRE